MTRNKVKSQATIDLLTARCVSEIVAEMVSGINTADPVGLTEYLEGLLSASAESYYFDNGQPDLTDSSEYNGLSDHLWGLANQFDELADEWNKGLKHT